VATDKLRVYNAALRQLGQRKLSSLSENGPSRRVLDDHWPDVLDYCLEQGLWNFAMRAVEMDSSASAEIYFGFDYAYQKPDDWLRSVAFSDDGTFRDEFTDVRDENGFWFANCQPLYVRFISHDRGIDLSTWPQTFADYVATRLAYKSAPGIVNSDAKTDALAKAEMRARSEARNKDAMNEPSQPLSEGRWVQARRGFRYGSRYSGCG